MVVSLCHTSDTVFVVVGSKEQKGGKDIDRRDKGDGEMTKKTDERYQFIINELILIRALLEKILRREGKEMEK